MQPGSARHQHGPRVLGEDEQVLPACTQVRRVPCASMDLEAEDVLIKRELPIELGDGQRHRANLCVGMNRSRHQRASFSVSQSLFEKE